jgi:hypothetical protein
LAKRKGIGRGIMMDLNATGVTGMPLIPDGKNFAPNPQDINKPKDPSSEFLEETAHTAYLQGLIDSSGLSWILHGDGQQAVLAELQKAEMRGGIVELKALETQAEFVSHDRIDMVGVHRIIDRIAQLEADLNKIGEKNG